MSASTERKNRAAAREAGTDKKQLARQEAEKKAAKSKRRWTIGSILVALLLVAIILLNSGFLYKHTTAATAGDVKVSPVELSYYYMNQYSNFVNQYGSYASLFGLDTTQGVSSLGSQECAMLGDGQTWRDYFLQGALSSLQQVTALGRYAEANGISLDADELAEIDSYLENATVSARLNGFSSLDNFLAAQYGTGANARLIRSLITDSELAGKALDVYTDSLSFTDEELEEYYASLEGSSDLFDYDYFYVGAEKLPVEGAEGEDAETAVTEVTMLEARMTAEAIATAYRDGADIEDLSERFAAAIEAEDDTASPVQRRSTAGSGLGDLSEWLMDASRTAGDVTVQEDSANEGYYVAVFLSRDDNHYPTVSVRHILIQAEADADGNYSEEAKQAALDRINEILAEFEATDRSEESFAALAEQYSEDDGSNTNGGLYENIYKGQMVTEFNDFCFAEGRKSGDVGVVYGSNGGYAGYHLIYFVGEGELYSDVIARSALVSTAQNDFLAEQTAPYETALRYWAKLVG